MCTRERLVTWLHSKGDPARPTQISYALSRLRKEGLVQSTPLECGPHVYWLTRAGLRSLGLDGFAPQQPRFSQSHHDLALMELLQSLEESTPTGRWFTEVEGRRIDHIAVKAQTPDQRYSFPKLQGRPGTRQFPDLVHLTERGTRIIHELECSVKSAVRLRILMRGYVRAQGVEAVVYHAEPKALQTVQRRAAETNNWAVTSGYTARVSVFPVL